MKESKEKHVQRLNEARKKRIRNDPKVYNTAQRAENNCQSKDCPFTNKSMCRGVMIPDPIELEAAIKTSGNPDCQQESFLEEAVRFVKKRLGFISKKIEVKFNIDKIIHEVMSNKDSHFRLKKLLSSRKNSKFIDMAQVDKILMEAGTQHIESNIENAKHFVQKGNLVQTLRNKDRSFKRMRSVQPDRADLENLDSKSSNSFFGEEALDDARYHSPGKEELKEFARKTTARNIQEDSATPLKSKRMKNTEQFEFQMKNSMVNVAVEKVQKEIE